MADDSFYMKQALQEAQKAFERGEVPVGAVVVCRDRIIARSHHLTEALNDVTAHAEMQAITAAANYLGGKYLADCTLYVTVEPCVMCAGAIAWSQMGRLVFGAADEKRGYQRYAPNALHPKTVVAQGVMEEDCALLMKDFFKKRRQSLISPPRIPRIPLHRPQKSFSCHWRQMLLCLEWKSSCCWCPSMKCPFRHRNVWAHVGQNRIWSVQACPRKQ